MMTFQTFLGVAAEYNGDRFITLQDGVWKVSQQRVILAVEFISVLACHLNKIHAYINLYLKISGLMKSCVF